MQYDVNKLHADWFERRDPGRAAADGASFLSGVCEGMIDSVANIDYLHLAVEPVWDSAEGNPLLALRALRAAEPEFRNAERSGGFKDPSRIYLRGRYSILRARAEFRTGRYRSAFEWCLAARTWLENEVGGTEALRDVIGRTSNPVAELTVAELGIYPAVLRRMALEGKVRHDYEESGLELVAAYAQHHAMPVYPRTPALAAQWLYLLIERGKPNDTGLIDALYELDVRTRPQHARGQSTCELRDYAYARWQGRATDAEDHRQQATADLDRYQLHRHQSMVDRYGYLAA